MLKKWCLFLSLTLTVMLVSACSAEMNQPAAPDVRAIIQRFIDADLPVGRVVVYDASTDPNSMLGRPKSYTAKASFADTRISQTDDEEIPRGGTIEIFANSADAKSRYDYVSAFDGSIFGSYQYLHDTALLRIGYDLTPEQADAYDKVLIEAIK